MKKLIRFLHKKEIESRNFLTAKHGGVQKIAIRHIKNTGLSPERNNLACLLLTQERAGPVEGIAVNIACAANGKRGGRRRIIGIGNAFHIPHQVLLIAHRELSTERTVHRKELLRLARIGVAHQQHRGIMLPHTLGQRLV